MPFQQGNSKLGKKIFTYSIPAGTTCPGKSKPCEMCYAQEGFFQMPSVAKSHQRNWDETKDPGFAEWAIDELYRLKAKVVRVHVAGDVYDVAYAKKWLKIFKGCPDVRFFIYSRSWRIPEIRPFLVEMSKCSNVKMWWSVDWDTGKPANKPKTVRLAYMQINAADIPKFKVDLVFRVDELRNTIVKRVNGALVCPVENGVTENMNCMKCGFCWRNKGEVIDWGKTKTNRFELELV